MIYFEINDPEIKSGTNELWKGCTLAWHHNFTHIATSKELRGLQQKLDALRVQTRESLSKYEGFGRKLISYKGISFLITYLNFILFVWSICTIQRHIINFQPFLTSFDIFHACNDLFWARWPGIWKALQMNSKKVVTCHDIIISPT